MTPAPRPYIVGNLRGDDGDTSVKRLHLFEWEDQAWFPDVFRHFITDHLVFHMSRAYAAAVPLLARTLAATGHRRLVDLCSGSGGPVPALVPALSAELGAPVHATLTDRYPNIDAFERARASTHGSIDYRREPIDAMDCPATLAGFRTIFSSLHHFRPRRARRILADAHDKGVPIAVLEVQERRPAAIVLLPLAMLVGAFVLTPFLGRLSPARLVLTYVVPLAPLFFAWDTFVSCLRTYTPDELRALVDGMGGGGYRWEIGRIRAGGYLGPYRITYLVGLPGAG